MSRPPIDRAQVLHVARLASLSLSDDEADHLAKDLAAIVAYVDQLETLDTTGVEPTAQVVLGRAAWREDEVRPGLSHEQALAQAPRVEAEGFAVPTFVE